MEVKMFPGIPVGTLGPEWALQEGSSESVT